MQCGNTARYSKIVRYLESPCDDKKRVSARRELETQTDQVCFKKKHKDWDPSTLGRKQQKDRNIKKHSILMD